jgi:hypothetical protein
MFAYSRKYLPSIESVGTVIYLKGVKIELYQDEWHFVHNVEDRTQYRVFE